MHNAIQEMRDNRGERLILHSPNLVNLCIDSYNAEEQCGRLYHQYTDHEVFFSSLFEALDRMERLYDDLQFPQSATRLRRFLSEEREQQVQSVKTMKAAALSAYRYRKNTDSLTAAMLINRARRLEEERNRRKAAVDFGHVIAQKGDQATFLIRVQYRQFSTWQGEVTWMEGRRRLLFRSVLELITRIDDAMGINDMDITGWKTAKPGNRLPARAGNQEGKGAGTESGYHGIR